MQDFGRVGRTLKEFEHLEVCRCGEDRWKGTTLLKVFDPLREGTYDD